MSDTLGTIQGAGSRIVGAVVTNDDKQKRGRVQVLPTNLGGIQNIDDAPWCFVDSGPKSGFGGTPHTDFIKGSMVELQRKPDGTYAIVNAITSEEGQGAGQGSSGAGDGKNMYPSVSTGSK